MRLHVFSFGIKNLVLVQKKSEETLILAAELRDWSVQTVCLLSTSCIFRNLISTSTRLIPFLEDTIDIKWCGREGGLQGFAHAGACQNTSHAGMPTPQTHISLSREQLAAGSQRPESL